MFLNSPIVWLTEHSVIADGVNRSILASLLFEASFLVNNFNCLVILRAHKNNEILIFLIDKRRTKNTHMISLAISQGGVTSAHAVGRSATAVKGLTGENFTLTLDLQRLSSLTYDLSVPC